MQLTEDWIMKNPCFRVIANNEIHATLSKYKRTEPSEIIRLCIENPHFNIEYERGNIYMPALLRITACTQQQQDEKIAKRKIRLFRAIERKRECLAEMEQKIKELEELKKQGPLSENDFCQLEYLEFQLTKTKGKYPSLEKNPAECDSSYYLQNQIFENEAIKAKLY